jgi:hypothetical protein
MTSQPQQADAGAKVRILFEIRKKVWNYLQISGIMPIFATSEQMFWLSG